jgi:tRNA dimethylallyltransferase
MNTKPQIICVVGPTATGKSDLAVELALRFNGEVISADSRQVYKDLDLGTGKITTEEMQGVPHHLLDVTTADKRFTAFDWVNQSQNAINDIINHGRLPIICGGTYFYVSALIHGIHFPELEIDKEEQTELESKEAEELFSELKRIDPRRAENIDQHNKRRLSRAISIARAFGFVPPLVQKESPYDVLWIGTRVDDATLRERINARLVKRMDMGMLDEARKLHTNGLSFERMNELGLEYRYMAQLLQNQISEKDFYTLLSTKIWQFARRQKTWFRKNADIKWFNPKDIENIEKEVQGFLK